MDANGLRKLRAFLVREREIKSRRVYNKCRKYLSDLPEPQSLAERSFLQYKTQCYVSGNGLTRLAENIYSALELSSLIGGYSDRCIESGKSADAVFYNSLGKDIIPDELKTEFPEIVVDDGSECAALDKDDIAFIDELKERFRSPYFIFKTVIKIATYGGLIKKYRPKAIIATSEYSFCSSVLTDYCRRKGVLHIDVMHGEKLFDMVSTFFEFDRCYVWDARYADLFGVMRAAKGQFIVAKPKSLVFTEHKSADCDLKVCLSDETKTELKRMFSDLDTLKGAGKDFDRIVIRPHPIYTDRKTLDKVNGGRFAIEEPKEVPIERSLCESRYVMARFSTVLYQAYLNGIEVIIDDRTSPGLYKMLGQRGYVMTGKENVRRLSDLLT